MPVARYLVAGYHGRLEIGRTYVANAGEVIDTMTLIKSRFSRDGRRLFVQTSGQTIYILDLSALARPYNARHPGNSKNLRREEKCLDFHYLDLCR